MSHDLTLVLGGEDGERSVQASGLDDILGSTITLVDTRDETRTGERIARVASHLQGERFIVSYGDAVANVDVFALLDFHCAHGNARGGARGSAASESSSSTATASRASRRSPGSMTGSAPGTSCSSAKCSNGSTGRVHARARTAPRAPAEDVRSAPGGDRGAQDGVRRAARADRTAGRREARQAESRRRRTDAESGSSRGAVLNWNQDAPFPVGRNSG
jgi:hypothetical protein